MNDFLQSLRTGQSEKQRPQKTRKSHDNSYHYSSGPRYQSYGSGYQNTRTQQMRRPTVSQQAGNQMPADNSVSNTMLTDAIETLSEHIETLAKNQEYLIRSQERTADMMERQALAIERIVSHLNINSQNEDQPQKKFRNHYVTPVKEHPAETPVQKQEPVEKKVIRKRKKIVSKAPVSKPSVNDQKLLSREEIMDIIHTMREEGETFDQIASRLVALGQPTFSGRGEWHAQTIHRLCNKK